MEVKQVKIVGLKAAAHNPKARSSTKDSHVVMLSRSIEAQGLIYPIAITKTNQIIDGHRRLAAVKLLGWDKIPALVVSTEDPEQVYAEVNANARFLSGNDNLNVWLKQPRAVTGRAAKRFEAAEAAIGKPLLQKLAKNGLSLRVVDLAHRISRYVEREDKAFVVKTVNWLARHRNMTIMRGYIGMHQPVNVLYRAINSGKDLRTKFVTSK